LRASRYELKLSPNKYNNTSSISPLANMSGGWNTIESDAGVFTYLIDALGVKDVQFEELISLDEDSLEQLNPIGVIFLFKYPTDEKPRKDTPQDGEFDYAALEYKDDEEPVWFAAQTIQNACGTQALLSVLLNKDGAQEDGGVHIGPTLKEFKEFTAAFPSDVQPPLPHLHPSQPSNNLSSSAAKPSPTPT
jgi:ubiquitin carboxyl-terminal hydrolase L5